VVSFFRPYPISQEDVVEEAEVVEEMDVPSLRLITRFDVHSFPSRLNFSLKQREFRRR
jgi:hypothetical protein